MMRKKLAPAVLFAALSTTLGAATITLSVVGQARSTDGTDFFINSPADPVYTEFAPTSTIREDRAVFESNLAGCPRARRSTPRR